MDSPPRRRKGRARLDREPDLAVLFHGLQQPKQQSVATLDVPDAQDAAEPLPRRVRVVVLPPPDEPPPRPPAPIRKNLSSAILPSHPPSSPPLPTPITVDDFLSGPPSARRATATTTYTSKAGKGLRLRRKGPVPPPPSISSLPKTTTKTRRRARLVVESDSESSDDDTPPPPPRKKRRRFLTANSTTKLLHPLPVANYLGGSSAAANPNPAALLVPPYAHAAHRRPLVLAKESHAGGEEDAEGIVRKGREVKRRKKGAPGRKESWLGRVADTAFAKVGRDGGKGVEREGDDVFAEREEVEKKRDARRIFTGEDEFVQLVTRIGPLALEEIEEAGGGKDAGKRGAKAKGKTKGKTKLKTWYAPLDLVPEDADVEMRDPTPAAPPPKKQKNNLLLATKFSVKPHPPASPVRAVALPVFPSPIKRKTDNWNNDIAKMVQAFHRTLRVRPPLGPPPCFSSRSATDPVLDAGEPSSPPPAEEPEDGPSEIELLPTPRAPVFRFGVGTGRTKKRAAWMGGGRGELELVREEDAGEYYVPSVEYEWDDEEHGGLEFVGEDEYEMEMHRAREQRGTLLGEDMSSIWATGSFDSSAEFAKLDNFGDGRHSLPSPAPSSPPVVVRQPLERRVTFASPSAPPGSEDSPAPSAEPFSPVFSSLNQPYPSPPAILHDPHPPRPIARRKSAFVPPAFVPPPAKPIRAPTPLRRSRTTTTATTAASLILFPPNSSSAPSCTSAAKPKPLRRMSIRPDFRLPPLPASPEAEAEAEADDEHTIHESSHEYEHPSSDGPDLLASPSSPSPPNEEEEGLSASWTLPPPGQQQREVDKSEDDGGDEREKEEVESELEMNERAWERLVMEAVETEEERELWRAQFEGEESEEEGDGVVGMAVWEEGSSGEEEY